MSRNRTVGLGVGRSSLVDLSGCIDFEMSGFRLVTWRLSDATALHFDCDLTLRSRQIGLFADEDTVEQREPR